MHVFDVDSLDDLENELSILKRIRYKELVDKMAIFGSSFLFFVFYFISTFSTL